MEESIKLFALSKIFEATEKIKSLSDNGYFVQVGGRFAVFNDSNSGWGLADFPEEVLTDWQATDLVDDIVLTHDVLEVNIVVSRKYKREALGDLRKAKCYTIRS